MPAVLPVDCAMQKLYFAAGNNVRYTIDMRLAWAKKVAGKINIE